MKGKLNGIFKEAQRDYKIISKTYKILVKTFDMKIQMHSAGQWILDNMYIVNKIRYKKTILIFKYSPHNIPIIYPIVMINIGLFN